MKRIRRGVALSLFVLAIASSQAQSSESFSALLSQRVRSEKLSLSEHIKDSIKDGKLSLSLHDAILLTLENNSNVRVQETQIESQKFNLLAAHQPFDPLIQSKLDINRNSSLGFSQLQGIGQSGSGTLNALTQAGQINYTQTFITGTTLTTGISATKFSSNNSFYFLNPNFNSLLNFGLTQPLLRNAGRFANNAPMVIARRAVDQSRDVFKSLVSDSILQVVTQYWAAVQARGSLEVDRRSIQLAETSYDRDKRALELGALPPLDIYRSQSELAARRVQVIQAEYELQRAEEDLRLTIGADQDPLIRSLELNLTEKPEPPGQLEEIDPANALSEALAGRPEIAAVASALANDQTSIRLAHNHLRPDLTVSGFYQSNGIGGNQYDLTSGKLIAPGGLGSSFNQLFGFGYPGYGGTLTLNLPLRNPQAHAGLGNALVARTHDLYSDRQTREVITREVRNAVHQFEEAKLALAAGRISLDLAQKSLAAEQRKFELGAQTNFFVLDAQSKLAQAELDLVRTQISYQVARASVGHATGDLLTPYQVQITGLSE